MTSTDRPSGRAPVLRVRRVVGWLAGAVLVLLALLVVAPVAWMSLVGPIPMPFVAARGQAELARVVGAAGTVSVGPTRLAFDWEAGLSVQLDDVRLSGPAGSVDAPAILIDFDIAEALLGRFAIQAIILDRPSVALAATGSLDIGTDPMEALGGLDERLARLVDMAASQGLHRFIVRDGHLTLPVAAPGLEPRSFDPVDIHVAIDAGGTLTATLTAGTSLGQTSLSLVRVISPDQTLMKAEAENFALLDLLPVHDGMSGLPLNGHFEATFGTDHSVRSARLSGAVGEGYIAMGESDVPLAGGRLEVIADPAANRLDVTAVEFTLSNFDVLLSGQVMPPQPGDTTWTFAFHSEKAQARSADGPGDPIAVDAGSFTGSVDFARRQFHMDRIHVVVGDASADMTVALNFQPVEPRLIFDLTVSPVDLSVIYRFWPPYLVMPARQYLVQNLTAGRIVRGHLHAVSGPAEFDRDPVTHSTFPGRVHAELSVTGARLVLPGAWPALSGASADATFDDDHLTVALTAGQLGGPSDKPLAVRSATLDIPNMRDPSLTGTVIGQLAGPAAPMAALADVPPLNALTSAGINPADLSGSVVASFQLDGPLGASNDPRLLNWHVAATVTDGASSAPVAGAKLSNANLSIAVDSARVDITGRARMDGFDITVDLSRPFGRQDGGRNSVRFVLTDAERRRRGWNFDDVLAGPVPVEVEADPGQPMVVVADLAKAKLSLPIVGWSKDAGVPATARALLDIRPDQILVRELAISSDGVDIRGGGTLERDGRLKSADFSQLALRPGDDARVRIQARDGGGYRVAVTASSLDARGLIGAARKPGSGASGGGDQTPIDISATVQRLRGFNAQTFSGVTLTAFAAGPRVQRLSLDGSIGDGASVSASVQPDQAQRVVSLAARDVGALLRFLDIYRWMQGGDGRIAARIDATGRVSGTATVASFGIAEDPAIRTILKRTSDEGAVVLPKTDASHFDQMLVRFDLSGPTLTIREATLRGPVSGGNASGAIDLSRGTLSMSGTFIPLYAINNLFGRIPLVGRIIGDGSGGGLIGVTFRISGPVDKPQVSFNPVSAVTPGIFRKVFEYGN